MSPFKDEEIPEYKDKGVQVDQTKRLVTEDIELMVVGKPGTNADQFPIPDTRSWRIYNYTKTETSQIRLDVTTK